MPWHVVPDHPDCGDGKFAVVTNDTDEVESCHATREAAEKRVASLYGDTGGGKTYAAAMSAASINDLPDSAFAYIQPGGAKDADGKTVPRSLRHFPIHDACLAAGTVIPLLDGRAVAIEDLIGLDEFWVYAFDPETRSIVPGRGHSARKTMKATVVAHVRLDNGEVLRTTPDHRFMLRSGEYRQAQDLAPGDSLMPLRRKVYATRSSKKSGHRGKAYEFIFQPFYRFWELTHHAVDRHAHGVLVDGNVVHHRNDDQFDNQPANLEQMTRAAHCSHHGEANGWKHIERLQEGSRQRWAEPGARQRQAAHRRRLNVEMKAAGVLPTKPMKQWCATRENAVVIHERYIAGEGIAGLARELGVSESGIKLGFKRYGLPSRRELAAVNNHKVVRVEFRDGDPQPVYDISVDEFHNFATAAGVFVHNSHVRNALSRAPQSPFGDKAMPKIRAAAKRFGIRVSVAAAELLGVELARPGAWNLKTGPLTVTPQHLDDAARFANRDDARPGYIKLGHTDARFMAGDGEPALGWLHNLRVEDDDGPVLKGDLKDLPDWLAKAIPRHWPDRSIEGYEDYEHDGETYSLVVDGLSLLGVTPPGMASIRSLRDLPAALGVAASLEPSGHRIVASFGDPTTSAPEAEEPSTKGAGMTLAKYREALDELPDDASEEDARAALVAAGLSLAPPEATSQPVAASAAPMTPAAIMAAAAKAGMRVVSDSVWDANQDTIKTLTDFMAKTKRDERDEVIAKAVQAGKFTPVQKPHFATLWDADPDGTRALINTLTPNSALAVMASGYAGEEGIEEDELDREIARLSPPVASKGA